MSWLCVSYYLGCVNQIVNFQELACAYTILLMAIYWISEVVPLAVTALLPLVFYPLLGVVNAKKVV